MMALAGMVATDEDALTCDLWEVYGVTDWRALPPSKVAVLAFGLSKDSRIKMAISGQRHTMTELMLAAIADGVRGLEYGLGIMKEKPTSILSAMIGPDSEPEYNTYNSPEEFMAARDRIIKRIKDNGDNS